MTGQEIIDKTNTLARMFYKQNGYNVEEGYRFDQAHHPQELGMWNMASAAVYFLTGDDPEDALSNLE